MPCDYVQMQGAISAAAPAAGLFAGRIMLQMWVYMGTQTTATSGRVVAIGGSQVPDAVI